MDSSERGEALKLLRKKLGLTQRELGERVIPREVKEPGRAVQKWESGSTQPRLDIIEGYLDLLETFAFIPGDMDMTFEGLLEDIDSPEVTFGQWKAMLSAVWFPSSIEMVPVAHVDDRSLSFAPFRRYQFKPTHDRIIFAGPGGHFKLRIGRDGSIDCTMPKDWHLEKVGARKYSPSRAVNLG